MVAMDRTQSDALRNCSEGNFGILRGHQAFGHLHSINANARCSFLLWAHEEKSYIAVQSL
jgi:hypothetical protein